MYLSHFFNKPIKLHKMHSILIITFFTLLNAFKITVICFNIPHSQLLLLVIRFPEVRKAFSEVYLFE